MKKLISAILMLAMALSLVACGASGQEATEGAPKVFMAGYGRADITPKDPGVNMRGFGDEATRLSQGYISKIYVDVLALTDEEGNTALLMSYDLGGTSCHNAIHTAVSEATGVPEVNIVTSCSHQHSGPHDPLVADYREFLVARSVEAAKMAMDNRAPATMEVATVQTEGLNWVRHYVMNDGSYAGDNFGDTSSGYKEHVCEPDRSMQLVKFVREGDYKTILLTNFQGHPHMGSMKYYNEIHADTVGEYKDMISSTLGYEAIYFSGAGGNVKMTSAIEEENLTTDFKEHGKMLARYAAAAEGSYSPLATGTIRAMQSTYTATIDHSLDNLVNICQQVYDHYQKNGSQKSAMKLAEGYPISSYHHATAILSKAKLGATGDIEHLGAIAVGELAFVAAPYEMFSVTGEYIKENSPFTMTVVCTIANGGNGYFPDDSVFEYGSYESDTSKYIRGTAEGLADRFLEMLNEVKAG